MSGHAVLGILASIIGIAAYLIYLSGVFRNNEKPHIFTWILWGVMTALLWYVQLINGAGPGAWVTLTGATFCFIIAACAWKRGEKNITRSDWFFFTLGLGSIALWVVTREALAAVILLTLIDVLGIVPTIRKSLINPWQENMDFYTLTAVKYALSLFAIKNMILVNWLFPAAMVVECVAMALILFIGRKMKKTA